MTHDSRQLTQFIKQTAAEAGFDACGIAAATVLETEAMHLDSWLAAGCHAGMAYMARNVAKRANPALLVENARSVAVMLLNYKPPQRQPASAPQVAYYAYGVDYHDYIREKLAAVIAAVKTVAPETAIRGFVDTAPVLEKAWAVRAGLGWIGKNNLLISPTLGSFTFIATLMLDAPLEYATQQEKNRCGKCTRCIDACPGRALQPYRLNAHRCISYHNKRKGKNGVPLENYCFGCDYCQLACPWNEKTPPHRMNRWTIPEIVNFSAGDWERLDEPAFNTIFARSALQDVGFAKLKANLNVCTGKPS
ncbi:MAG: tRNA epoxyqueuosine(34) reductase QueG [Prevotellaceae bacterium]|jgi:epoxyqueuosine reductase|nr:tRNA epoxyqueuosine(34) reductase QueG [Prevotellaceae bacterium]